MLLPLPFDDAFQCFTLMIAYDSVLVCTSIITGNIAICCPIYLTSVNINNNVRSRRITLTTVLVYGGGEYP